MMRYEYCRLEPYQGTAQYRQVTSSDPEMIQELLTEIGRVLPKASQANVENDLFSGSVCSVRLVGLKGKDARVFDAILGWLCHRGWEPYAVYLSSPIGNIQHDEVQHLRKAVSE